MSHGRGRFELIIGLVGGVGTNFDQVFHELKSAFELAGCYVEKIKITKFLRHQQKKDFLSDLEEKIYKMNIARESIENGIASLVAINYIFYHRLMRFNNEQEKSAATPTIYVIDSLKHPDEYDVLRNVYRRNFILISVFEPKDNREKNLLSNQLKSLAPTEVI